MTNVSTIATFMFGDMTIAYQQHEVSHNVSLRIYPTSMQAKLVPHRETLPGYSIPAWYFEPLVQFKLLGDPTDEYCQGQTMRNSASLLSLQLDHQEVVENQDQTEIITRLSSARGYAADHHLVYNKGDAAVTIFTTFINQSTHPLTLEMLASFSLSGISPFAEDDAPGRLYLHRMGSYWSAEGRHDCRLAENLGLTPSWANHGVRVERFGQIGSMPVRTYFPWAAVEDREAGVFWGAQLSAPASWQMEFFRRDDFLALSGGLADREFGHWLKTIGPGEQFTAPVAYVSTVQGDLDDLCARLVSMQLPAAERAPEIEHDLPVICNEYCYSWGNPRHEDLVAMADRLQGSGIKYLVIDAGWYKDEQGVWDLGQGDWIANKTLFPRGLSATAQAIRERGLIPGIWFEMEVVGRQSPRFEGDIQHALHRDGLPITASNRHFWDFRDPWVVDFLSDRVIGQLKENGIGYIKVDYNETIGIGVDGAESAGEGLRQHMHCVQDFFRKMRADLPNLVIENCSSGGHRLEPSFMGLTSMASFSDAHETKDIPVIAANLHRLILPRQSQIWAVLHANDSMERLVYLLSGGFLGRLCLSGEIAALNSVQWEAVKESIRFYQHVSPVIARGKSRVYQQITPNWRYLEGAQAVLRVSEDDQSALLVTHSFGNPLPAEIRVQLPGTGWQIADCFPKTAEMPVISGNEICYRPAQEWNGMGLYLTR